MNVLSDTVYDDLNMAKSSLSYVISIDNKPSSKMTEQEAWEAFFAACNRTRASSVKMIFEDKIVADRKADNVWAILKQK